MLGPLRYKPCKYQLPLLANTKFPPNISSLEYKPPKNKVNEEYHVRFLNLSKTGKYVKGYKVEEKSELF